MRSEGRPATSSYQVHCQAWVDPSHGEWKGELVSGDRRRSTVGSKTKPIVEDSVARCDFGETLWIARVVFAPPNSCLIGEHKDQSHSLYVRLNLDTFTRWFR